MRFFMHEARQRGGSQATMFGSRDMKAINHAMKAYEQYRPVESLRDRMNNAKSWLNLWRSSGGGGAARTPVVIHQAVNLDGRKVGSSVTRHQVAMANGPSHGAQSFDGTRHHSGPDSAFLVA